MENHKYSFFILLEGMCPPSILSNSIHFRFFFPTQKNLRMEIIVGSHYRIPYCVVCSYNATGEMMSDFVCLKNENI